MFFKQLFCRHTWTYRETIKIFDVSFDRDPKYPCRYEEVFECKKCLKIWRRVV